MKFRSKIYLFTAGALAFCFFSHNISKEITPEDAVFVQEFLKLAADGGPVFEKNCAQTLDYENQLALIKKVQKAVLSHAPNGDGIPLGSPRNPKDLFLAKQGLCYDRSFSFEKIFGFLGFGTRHASVFRHAPGRSKWEEFFSKTTASHAITEVRTASGWLILDTNYCWLGLDGQNAPVSFEKLETRQFKMDWATPPDPETAPFFNFPTTFIYGFYSRHGQFFPPFDFVPDYRIQELKYNF